MVSKCDILWKKYEHLSFVFSTFTVGFDDLHSYHFLSLLCGSFTTTCYLSPPFSSEFCSGLWLARCLSSSPFLVPLSLHFGTFQPSLKLVTINALALNTIILSPHRQLTLILWLLLPFSLSLSFFPTEADNESSSRTIDHRLPSALIFHCSQLNSHTFRISFSTNKYRHATAAAILVTNAKNFSDNAIFQRINL